MYLYIYCMKNNLNDAFAHQHKEQDDDNHILSHVVEFCDMEGLGQIDISSYDSSYDRPYDCLRPIIHRAYLFVIEGYRHTPNKTPYSYPF